MTDDAGLDPTLWQRVRRWLARMWRKSTFRPEPGSTPGKDPDRKPDEIEDRRVVVRPDATYFEWQSPALGDAFCFVVGVRVTWSAARTRKPKENKDKVEGELKEAVDKVRGGLEPTLRQEVRAILREIPPHRAAQAEKALNDRLGRTVCHTDGDVESHYTFFVDVVEPVRQKLEEPAFAHLAIDLQGELSMAQAEIAARAQRAWQEFLQAGLDDLKGGVNGERPRFTRWLAPWAMQLAENPVEIGSTLRAMYVERAKQVEDLFSEVHRMTTMQNELEVLDFTLRHDTALRALFEAMMITVDPAAPDSPFVGDQP